MQIGLIGCAGVGGDEDMVVKVKGVTSGAVYTAFRGQAADCQGVPAPRPQGLVKAGAEEGAVAALGDDQLAVLRVQVEEFCAGRFGPTDGGFEHQGAPPRRRTCSAHAGEVGLRAWFPAW